MYMAAEGNHLEMLKYLVTKGADININDNDGVSIYETNDSLRLVM